MIPYEAAEDAWRSRLRDLISGGVKVAPRGQATLELLHPPAIYVDLNRPLIRTPARALNYQFAHAEALWITDGQNNLDALTRFVKRMADFSDDGVTLAGAYGPPITAQLPYIVDTLLRDPSSRQAVLTIWRPSPPPSKDIPCTVAMSFAIRHGVLYQHVFMRSSDAWLGVPYDLFSFATVAARVACELNGRRGLVDAPILLGGLALNASSSHLYVQNIEATGKVLAEARSIGDLVVFDPEIVGAGDWPRLRDTLVARREDKGWRP